MKPVIPGHFFDVFFAVNPDIKHQIKIYNGMFLPEDKEDDNTLDGVLEHDLIDIICNSLLSKSKKYEIDKFSEIAEELLKYSKDIKFEYGKKIKERISESKPEDYGFIKNTN